VQVANGPAACHSDGVNVPHRFTEVLGLWVVGAVHGHGLGVVVDADVHMPAVSLFKGRACATATGEQVDPQFVFDVENELLAHAAA